MLNKNNTEQPTDTNLLAIYDEIAKLRDILTAKNKDYGSSAFERPYLDPGIPAVDAILVRMSDKVNRLHNIIKRGAVCDESIDDTVLDLAGYCILFLANRHKK